MLHDPAVVSPREPWKVTFTVGQVFIGCLLSAVFFMGLIYLYLAFAVPDEVYAGIGSGANAAQLTLNFGGFAGVIFLILGPTFAFGLGRLLRKEADQSKHVLAFAGTGAAVGFGLGMFFGWDLAFVLGPTMGTAVGLSRMIMSRFALV